MVLFWFSWDFGEHEHVDFVFYFVLDIRYFVFVVLLKL